MNKPNSVGYLKICKLSQTSWFCLNSARSVQVKITYDYNIGKFLGILQLKKKLLMIETDKKPSNLLKVEESIFHQ